MPFPKNPLRNIKIRDYQRAYHTRSSLPPPGQLTLHIAERMLQLGLTNQRGRPDINLLVKRAGICYPSARLLIYPDKHPPARIDLTTLARLCDILQCQPGDLLTYTPYTKLLAVYPTQNAELTATLLSNPDDTYVEW